MDAGTAAAIAALVVSILAMTVAFAQAVQQYLITGQLIRMCDSVVYGKMPGQGRRVWENSQFRFRVIYSVPQIYLRPNLWPDGFAHHSSNMKNQLPLPDLRHSTNRANEHWRWGLSGSPTRRKQSPYSATPGEACWVSFCRMVQHSTGEALLYEMVDGDADRCPSDLLTVPMRVSMRDIVTIALMTGMTCTDASLERKTLAMEGSAGTITSSSHPILGTLIRFTPKNSDRPQGLRIGDGIVNPDWMARMWDVIIVAGRHYSVREREFYEDLEASSRDLTVARFSGTKFPLRASSPAISFRSRRHSTTSIRSIPRRFSTSVGGSTVGVRVGPHLEQDSGNTTISLSRSPQDGDWSFASDETKPTATPGVETLPRTTQFQTYEASPQSNRPWYKRWRIWRRKHIGLNSCVVDMENCDLKEKPKGSFLDPANTPHQPNGSNVKHAPSIPSTVHPYPSPSEEMNSAAKMQRGKLLDGLALQNYIEEKKKAESNSSVRGRLLLPWYSGEEEGVDVRLEELDDWKRSYVGLKRERSMSYAEHWRDIVDIRQKRRETRDLQGWEAASQHSSRPSSIGADERFRRQRSTGTRSVSRDSQKNRRHSYSLPDPHREQSRGRPRERNSRRAEERRHFPGEGALGQINSEYSRTPRPQERSTAPESEDIVSYGDVPVLHQENNERKFSLDDNMYKSSRRKPGVTFQHDERSRSPPSPPSDGEDTHRQEKVDMVLQMLKSLLEHKMESESDETSSDGEDSASQRENQTLLPEHDGYQDQDEDAESEIEQDEESKHKKIEIVEPEQPETKPRKGILKPPKEQFPEELNVIREGVAPLKSPAHQGIPPGARWTKINRSLVNPEALEAGGERFEERRDYVIVLRVLTREEIEAYAKKTQQIRERREKEQTKIENKRIESVESSDSDDWGQSYPPSQPRIPSRPDNLGHDAGRNEEGAFKKNTVESEIGRMDLTNESWTTQDTDADSGACINKDWSNEAILGSIFGSQISESPTMISENEEEKGSFRFAGQPSGEDHRKVNDGIWKDGDRHTRFAKSQTSYREDRKQSNSRSRERGRPLRSPPRRSRERGRPLRSPSPPSHILHTDLQRPRSESRSSRTSTAPLSGSERFRPPRPKPRRGSTHSTISLPETPQSDEDDWEASGISGHDPRFEPNNPFAIEAGKNYALGDVDITNDPSTHPGDGSQIKGTVNWLWICQADVIPGYFATPWQSHFSESTCSGAIAVMLEALECFTDASSLAYVDSLPHCEAWVYKGRSTHPSYAIKAMGGIIVSAKYKRVKFATLATPIPPIQLLRCCNSDNSESTIVNRLSELMALDSWLSFCGRLPEICNGRNKLVQRMPALIQKIMSDFEFEFRNINQTAAEGGWQLIKELADLVLHELEDNLMLDDAERLFTLVAVLRTAKTALCVVLGPSTTMLRDVLLRDVQVYLV